MDELAAKRAKGHELDDLQAQKLSRRDALLAGIAAVEQEQGERGRGADKSAATCAQSREGGASSLARAGKRVAGARGQGKGRGQEQLVGQKQHVGSAVGGAGVVESWGGLQLDARICAALRRLGFASPTPIQSLSIHAIGVLCARGR